MIRLGPKVQISPGMAAIASGKGESKLAVFDLADVHRLLQDLEAKREAAQTMERAGAELATGPAPERALQLSVEARDAVHVFETVHIDKRSVPKVDWEKA